MWARAACSARASWCTSFPTTPSSTSTARSRLSRCAPGRGAGTCSTSRAFRSTTSTSAPVIRAPCTGRPSWMRSARCARPSCRKPPTVAWLRCCGRGPTSASTASARCAAWRTSPPSAASTMRPGPLRPMPTRRVTATEASPGRRQPALQLAEHAGIGLQAQVAERRDDGGVGEGQPACRIAVPAQRAGHRHQAVTQPARRRAAGLAGGRGGHRIAGHAFS
mmetsp:Transcript_54680/g.129216  ORF Transcript_54680/g.129216 Transcript_54680/m.129216 type:complete len:221 (+) Transcript_54680:365-1027(+)